MASNGCEAQTTKTNEMIMMLALQQKLVELRAKNVRPEEFK